MGSPHFIGLSRHRYHKLTRYALFLIVAFSIAFLVLDDISGPSRPTIQHRKLRRRPASHAQHDRLKAVRKEFDHAWNGYKEYAWMGDSLRPLSGTSRDQFCGWSATLVDTLDTLWIMGMKDEFDQAVNATMAIDFKHTSEGCQISLFESNIRYLGGLLAAYDLSGDVRLLPKLVELGEVLYGQFHTTNGMPCSHCRMIHGSERPTPPRDVPLADVGTFYLEFARLSQVTDNPKYLELVVFLTKVFESTQDDSTIPGLWPEKVDSSSVTGSTAEFATKSNIYGLGALHDSAYEYLVKAHLLLGGMTDRYATMWHKASAAIRANLLFRAYFPQSDGMDALFAGSATHIAGSEDLIVEPRIQHLSCFAGGMYAMSSKMFDNPVDLDIAIQLTQGCIWAYENSPTGIMPETVTLLNCPDMIGPQCAWNETLWAEAHANPPGCSYGMCQFNQGYPPGFLFSIDTTYQLRPEAIESVFILYRITGDEYYRDVGWRMFEKIIQHTRSQYGHAALINALWVDQEPILQTDMSMPGQRPPQRDEMESFWLAETLKYFWLLFSAPDLISLDDWVLNTEAHPLKLMKGIRGF